MLRLFKDGSQWHLFDDKGRDLLPDLHVQSLELFANAEGRVKLSLECHAEAIGLDIEIENEDITQKTKDKK